MQIVRLRIQNFKSIHDMELKELENALILVGKNSTGKTAVLDAVRAVGGLYKPQKDDFDEAHSPIRIEAELQIEEEDLLVCKEHGMISRYRNLEAWKKDVQKKLPSFQNGRLWFEWIARWKEEPVYFDGSRKNNPYIREIFPKIHAMDTQRNLQQFQQDLLNWIENDLMKQMRADCCMFERMKKCTHCFDCMGVIRKKTVDELNAFEVTRLLDYKLYQLNLDDFSRKLNENFHRNGGQEQIMYSMNRDVERMLSVTTEALGSHQKTARSIEKMGKGMRSVYMLSLLETYAQGEGKNQGIVLVEEPELFLHPQMQKIAGEILYRLSRKNQILFSTHSPNLLSNFNSRQIRQTYIDENGYSNVREQTDISRILDDLGYSAADLMNVDFVFIVEGTQDKNRLPLLLKRYYGEICREDGSLVRTAIISTNSCTNIKTYANLKYMNQVYLKDRFLMIRDGDGKDAEKLKRQLCRYYEDRNQMEKGALPRVRPENVLILKYYSFENYFLNPRIMKQIGILNSEEEFYEIFLKKWKEYLYRISSGNHLTAVLGKNLVTLNDVKENMETIRQYMRGHNLFDIYYGRYKKQETELLRQYVELAPREEFSDILEAIERFAYFENRKEKTDSEKAQVPDMESAE